LTDTGNVCEIPQPFYDGGELPQNPLGRQGVGKEDGAQLDGDGARCQVFRHIAPAPNPSNSNQRQLLANLPKPLGNLKNFADDEGLDGGSR
jgi:hypothetical protein